MGRSADAKLVFGSHVWKEDDEKPWGDDGDPEQWLLSVLRPDLVKPVPQNWNNITQDERVRLDAYYTEERRVLNTCGVSIEYAGPDEYPDYVLCASAAIERGDWCEPQTVDLSALLTKEAEVWGALLAFEMKAGLAHVEPRWMLLASFG